MKVLHTTPGLSARQFHARTLDCPTLGAESCAIKHFTEKCGMPNAMR
jgi:hypothetical protein